MTKKTVGIIGYGFVGKAVAQLSEVYKVNIYDPFVEEFGNVQQLSAAYTSDFVIVCVPTPQHELKTLDLSIVEECADRWAWYNIKKNHPEANVDSVLVIKSTISVGTIKYLISQHETDRIVHNPEFLTQRTAMEDFRRPVEVVIGAENFRVADKVVELYKGYYPFGDDEPQYFVTESAMAELIKMGRNSFYALKVMYFNELHGVCTRLGIEYDDFIDVFTLGGKHPWVAKQHTQVPGPDGMMGYGGACLPKDSQGLVELADRIGVKMPTLKAAVESNKRRRK